MHEERRRQEPLSYLRLPGLFLTERSPPHAAVLESSPIWPSHGPGTLSGLAPRVLAETQGHRRLNSSGPGPGGGEDTLDEVGTGQLSDALPLLPQPTGPPESTPPGTEALPVIWSLPTHTCKWLGGGCSRDRSFSLMLAAQLTAQQPTITTAPRTRALSTWLRPGRQGSSL